MTYYSIHCISLIIEQNQKKHRNQRKGNRKFTQNKLNPDTIIIRSAYLDYWLCLTTSTLGTGVRFAVVPFLPLQSYSFFCKTLRKMDCPCLVLGNVCD